jgi:hypothetical protein
LTAKLGLQSGQVGFQVNDTFVAIAGVINRGLFAFHPLL